MLSCYTQADHTWGVSGLNDQPKTSVAPKIALSIFVCIFLLSCGSGTKKLDEAYIYKGPHFQIKLVRYYENLPFHYTGEVFNVQCSSAQTANSPAHERQDAGWVTLGNGGAIGSTNAGQLAERELRNYLIVDEQTLVWVGNGFNISFDACGRFQSWYPTDLPADMIIPSEKPDYCQPKGSADCRHYDFMGDREPRFMQIQVSPQEGHISFDVHSKAFRNNKSLRLRSMDFGKTWQVETL